jgi:phytoene/squalene synthetase
MTELEKHLLEALEQAQAQQQQREADLQQMFKATRQENQAIKEAFKSLLDSISEADRKQADNWNNLTKYVSDLSGQLKDFERQNKLLNNQLTTIQEQLIKLKK